MLARSASHAKKVMIFQCGLQKHKPAVPYNVVAIYSVVLEMKQAMVSPCKVICQYAAITAKNG